MVVVDEPAPRCAVRGRPEVFCTTCKHPKAPRGRDAPAVLRMCDYDCPGYMAEPKPDQLWPGEVCEPPLCPHFRVVDGCTARIGDMTPCRCRSCR